MQMAADILTKFLFLLRDTCVPSSYDRWNFVGDMPVRCLKYLPNED